MLVAVEASADSLGAGLAHALKAKLGDGVELVGVGGAKMAAEGIFSPYDIGDLSLVGLFEIAGAVPLALRRLEETVQLAEAAKPDIAVLIDSWEFTWRVGRRMRLRTPDVALIKYVAPQVWATRPGRARVVARIFDRLMTLFDFETRHFEAEGVPTTSVGNPALRRDLADADPARLRAAIEAGPDDPILLVLPGSRRAEIARLMGPFGDAVARLKTSHPRLHVVLALAESVAEEARAAAQAWPVKPFLVEGEAGRIDAMKGATLALACSGTVTTELAMAGCPFVVAYRISGLTYALLKIAIKTRWITLINIASGREIAPELIQGRCTGPELAKALAARLDDQALRRRQIAEQTEALGKLGPVGGADPSERAADAVIAIIEGRTP
jgi:lipid-A-disaccharide synthase